MKKSCLVVMVIVAWLGVPAITLAHGGHLHKALGTIAGMQGEHVNVTTRDGKSLTVMLDKKTTITRGKDRLDAAALKVGERVSIEYVEEKKTMIARAIKLGTTTATK
jgi:hypothetical protein